VVLNARLRDLEEVTSRSAQDPAVGELELGHDEDQVVADEGHVGVCAVGRESETEETGLPRATRGLFRQVENALGSRRPFECEDLPSA
jgi:hypothetical protein